MVFSKIFRDPIGSNSDEFMPEIADEWSSLNRLNPEGGALARTDELVLNGEFQRRVVPNEGLYPTLL